MNKLYTYNFNYYYDFRTVKANTPLSLDEDGLLWPGAGLTIYRNSTVITFLLPTTEVWLYSAELRSVLP